MHTIGGIVHVESNCPHAEEFTYSTAKKGSKTTPCTNVPIICPLCPPPRNPRDKSPAIWKYNMLQHIQFEHPGHLANNVPSQAADNYTLTRSEYVALKIPQEQIPGHISGNPNASVPPPPQPPSRKRKSNALRDSNPSTVNASELSITPTVDSPAVEPLAEEPPAKRTRTRRK